MGSSTKLMLFYIHSLLFEFCPNRKKKNLYRKIIYRQLHGVFPSAYQKFNEFCRWFMIGYTFLQIVFLLLRAYTKNIPYRFYINLGPLIFFTEILYFKWL